MVLWSRPQALGVMSVQPGEQCDDVFGGEHAAVTERQREAVVPERAV
jgi:hypothetical protein